MKDFLGRDYGLGDTVVYAAGSGRSITMVYGEVVEVRDNGTIKIMPLRSARWKQHHGRDRYIDRRTGKGIDPYTDEHYATPPARRHMQTGEVISSDEYHRLRWAEQLLFDYVSPTLKDYVEKVHDPVKPVTITITDNIVKIERQPDPDEGAER